MLFGESLPFLSEWVMSHRETEDDRQSEIQSVKVTKIDRLGQIREKYIDIQEKKKCSPRDDAVTLSINFNHSSSFTQN